MVISSLSSFVGSLVPLGAAGTGTVAASVMEEGVIVVGAGVPETVAMGDPLPVIEGVTETGTETTLIATVQVEESTIHTALHPCPGTHTVCPLLGAWGDSLGVLPLNPEWGGDLHQSDQGGVVG